MKFGPGPPCAIKVLKIARARVRPRKGGIHFRYSNSGKEGEQKLADVGGRN